MENDSNARPAQARFMNVSAAADELGLSEMSLYRLIAAGEFPAVRCGRRLSVPRKVLDELEAAAITRGGVVDVAELARSWKAIHAPNSGGVA